MSYRLQFSPSGTFGTDLETTAWQSPKLYTFAEDTWDSYQAGDWAGGVFWRVEGQDSGGALALSATRNLAMDPDLDDDSWSQDDGDCDDDDAAVNPGATDVCNLVDDDCDGTVDGGLGEFWYDDVDGDGYGDVDALSYSCTGAPPGTVADATDCDDGDAGASPGNTEVCNDGVDNDCSGDAAGCGFGAAVLDTGDAALTLYGGYAAVLGRNSNDPIDLDGDGALDLLVGYPHYPRPRAKGRLLGFYAPLGAALGHGAADVWIDGDTNDDLGYTTRSAGDVNGDGWEDLLVGGEGGQGKTWLFEGPFAGGLDVGDAAATFTGYASGDDAWHGVGIGDIDGDGYGDIAVYDPGFDYGWVDIYPGPVYGDFIMGDGDLAYWGLFDTVGSDVMSGEFDGDGSIDLVIGAGTSDEGGSDAGAYHVCYGPDLWGGHPAVECGDYVAGTAASQWLSWSEFSSVAPGLGSAVADLDGDGLDDLVLGSPLYKSGTSTVGAAAVYLGPIVGGKNMTALAADYLRSGTSTSSLFGAHVRTGDLDGDGSLDVVVGEPKSDLGGSDAGQVVLMFGPFEDHDGDGDQEFASEVTIRGTTAFANFGLSFSVGDFNADGVDDLAVGEPYLDRFGGVVVDAGAVYVFYGGGQ